MVQTGDPEDFRVILEGGAEEKETKLIFDSFGRRSLAPGGALSGSILVVVQDGEGAAPAWAWGQTRSSVTVSCSSQPGGKDVLPVKEDVDGHVFLFSFSGWFEEMDEGSH